jgi:hypothetical protein
VAARTGSRGQRTDCAELGLPSRLSVEASEPPILLSNRRFAPSPSLPPFTILTSFPLSATLYARIFVPSNQCVAQTHTSRLAPTPGLTPFPYPVEAHLERTTHTPPDVGSAEGEEREWSSQGGNPWGLRFTFDFLSPQNRKWGGHLRPHFLQ